jgi:hypothetical protein
MGSPANFIAGGSILPATFVKIDATKSQPTVIAASAASDVLVGVAQEATDQPPIPQLTGTQYAADTGENCRVYQNGDTCLLQLGTGGATAGNELTSDASGKGVAASAGNRVGAIALQTGVAGTFIRVRVTDPYKI